MRDLPYRIIADAFDADLVRAAAASWLAADSPCWYRYASEIERKATCERWEHIPEPCARLLGQMALIAPRGGRGVPDLSLYGAGLHSMGRGDRLGMHLDADRHARLGLARAFNAVLFISEWRSEWGGQLVLEQAEIPPAFNRLVVFSPAVRHGVPTPLTCPEGVLRKTLALYFYSAAQSAGERARAVFYGPDGREIPR